MSDWTSGGCREGGEGLKGYSDYLSLYLLLSSLTFQGKTLQALHQAKVGQERRGRFFDQTIHRSVQQAFRNPSASAAGVVTGVEARLATASFSFTYATVIASQVDRSRRCRQRAKSMSPHA